MRGFTICSLLALVLVASCDDSRTPTRRSRRAPSATQPHRSVANRAGAGADTHRKSLSQPNKDSGSTDPRRFFDLMTKRQREFDHALAEALARLARRGDDGERQAASQPVKEDTRCSAE